MNAKRTGAENVQNLINVLQEEFGAKIAKLKEEGFYSIEVETVPATDSLQNAIAKAGWESQGEELFPCEEGTVEYYIQANNDEQGWESQAVINFEANELYMLEYGNW